MTNNKKRHLRWVRLDNAAKIYPAARRRNWSNVFRQSVTLIEPVDTAVLKSALDVTAKRFPSIAARLSNGAFWYYLREIENAPEIRQEQSYPLVFMSDEEMRKCAFRVIAYENRIAVEFFHSLTDGTGALIFLKSLTAEYLEQKYSISIPFEHGVLDRRQRPTKDELEDSFLKYSGKYPAGRKDTDAWRLSGTPEKDGFLRLTCFKIPVKEALTVAHDHSVSLTAFFSAVLAESLINLQKEKVPHIRRRKPIKVLIPVNLRNLFESNTLRNFAMYTIPEFDTRLGEYTFDEICKLIKAKMDLEVNQKYMGRVIATNVNDERNPLVRLIPLPLKNLVMKMVFDTCGERKSCLSISNLGLIKLPEIMKQYITRMDFILGVQAAAPYNCGILSYNDTVYINFIRNIREPDLERHFFLVLQRLGLTVTVESNN